MTLPLHTIASKVISLKPISFPRILNKLDNLIEQSDCTTDVIAAIVASDPMLSALALSRANTGTANEIHQVSSAVVMLGMSMVQGLVRQVRSVQDGRHKQLAGAWGLANAVGTMMRLIARHSRSGSLHKIDPEVLQIAGLLHDLGTITAMYHFPTQYAQAAGRLENEQGFFQNLLKQELGATSAELGAITARAWNLPQLMVSVCRHHLAPRDGIDYLEIVCATHVARILCRGCGFTVGADIYVEPLSDHALDILKLRNADIDELLKAFFREMEDLELYEGMLLA